MGEERWYGSKDIVWNWDDPNDFSLCNAALLRDKCQKVLGLFMRLASLFHLILKGFSPENAAVVLMREVPDTFPLAR